MEALTAVAASGLALIDMIKAIDPAAVLTDIRVEEKLGGKTGVWQRPDAAAGAGLPAGGPGSRAAGPPGGSGQAGGSDAAGGAA
jgi:cyclic pyranopterin phosphate synthase